MGADSTAPSDSVVRVAIVGGGPGGMAAAVQCARHGIKDLVLVERERLGGMLNYAGRIDNYLGLPRTKAKDMVSMFSNHLAEFGINVVYEEVTVVERDEEVYLIHTTDRTFAAMVCVVATGTVPRKHPILDKYATYLIEDGCEFKDKSVVVIGGGDVALDNALRLTPHARKVTVAARGGIKALPSLVHECQTGGIKLMENCGEVASASYRDGRYAIEFRSGMCLEADGIVVSIGRVPALDILREIKFGSIEWPSGRTDALGLYIIGDCALDSWRYTSVAAAMGTACGDDIAGFLSRR